MKKILSLLIAATMLLGMSTAVFADPTTTPTDTTSVDLTTVYKLINAGTTSPAEIITFNIEKHAVSDSSITDKDNIPEFENMQPQLVLDAGAAKANAGEAGVGEGKYPKQLTLPTYTSVGIYTYKITMQQGNSAGVTYDTNSVFLKVTVTQGSDGLIRSVALRRGTADNTLKSEFLENKYEAGTLTVTKNVAGLLGDKSKEFNVTVTFAEPQTTSEAQRIVVNSTITYTDDTTSKKIVPASSTDLESDTVKKWTTGENVNTASVQITLKDGENVVFNNIPKNVRYTVTESDYSSEGYKATYKVNDALTEGDGATAPSRTLGGSADTVLITNEKGGIVDTGIGIDDLPYIILLLVAVGGLGVFIARRRAARKS